MRHGTKLSNSIIGGGNFKFEAILGPDAVMKRHGHHYEDECQWNTMIEVAYHIPDQEMIQAGDGDAQNTVITIHDDHLHYITLGQMLIDLIRVAEPDLDVLRSLSPEAIPEEKEQQLEKKLHS